MDNTARVWEVHTGQAVATFTGHNNHIWGVAFSPDDKRIVSGSRETVARVWEFLFVEAAAHRAVAHCDARNRPVAKLLSRVGMRHEARQIEADYYKGEWTTLDSYAILARERVSE